MIKFNKDLLRVEYCALSQISTALGGSMRLATLDSNGEEVYTKWDIPFAVARKWKETYVQTRFMVPVHVAVVFYGDMVVMVERGPTIPPHQLEDPDTYGTLFNGDEFKSNVARSVDTIKKFKGDNWYTDGYSVYESPSDIQATFDSATSLTADGKFRTVNVNLVKFSEMNLISAIENPTIHSMVMVSSESGEIFPSPPIFKDVSDMRGNKLKVGKVKSGETPTADQLYRFDLIQKNYQVNLDFALNAGSTVGELFGYKAVGPLRLEQLMLALTTVNLPKIKSSVRSTFPIGMSFLESYAWLCGLMSTVKSLDELISMRALMKQLCQKGIFRRNTLERVFRKTEDGSVSRLAPALKTVEELKTFVDQQTVSDQRLTTDLILRQKKTKKSTQSDQTIMQVDD